MVDKKAAEGVNELSKGVEALKNLNRTEVVKESVYVDPSMMTTGKSPDPQPTPEDARHDMRFRNRHSPINETGVSAEELEKAPDEIADRMVAEMLDRMFKGI